MNLSLRQLEVYAAVARSESFTTAARELRISQPALSRTVLEIERTLRVRLFDRTTRRVRRTAEGEELLAVAERLLGAHRAEMNRLDRFLTGEAGTVTIATLPSVAAVLLPPVIARFHEQRPDVGVRVRDAMSATSVRTVAAGEADLAIALADDLPAGLVARPLVRDRFFAALPPRHPRAARPELRWAELGGERFVAIGADSSVRQFTDRAFAAAGARVAATIEVGNVSTVGGVIAAGLGVSALPALVRVLMSFAELAHRPLVDPVVERELSLVVVEHAPLPPAARHFVRLLDELPASDHTLPDDVRWA